VLRRCLVLAALLSLVTAADAHAHAALVASNPEAGSTLGDAPTALVLTFTEDPEPSLSTVQVTDDEGVAVQTDVGRAPDDARSLVVRVKPLARGVYTVSWRVVSALDAHATSGAYAFGIGVPPGSTALGAGTSVPATSRLEFAARWIFLGGLIVLIGAAAASLGRFGGPRDVVVGAAGWAVAVVGLCLLFEAQRRVAGVSFDELLDTSVGEALEWRAVALGAAGLALVLAAFALPPIRALALGGAGVAAAAAVALHVAAGHAAADSPRTVNIAAQFAHVVAAGVWLGGLGALLVGVRGRPSALKAAAVRRFSMFAAAGLILVVATGVARAIAELSAWSDLYSTGYGRAVLAKTALLAVVAGLGAANRWWSLPRAATDLRPLRRTGRVELAAAVAALGVAALLGTLAPPAAGRHLGFDVSGADVASSVRVRLTTASTQPGPNRFVLRAADDDTGEPLDAAGVRLRFRALDDPEIAPTALDLRRDPKGTYAATGSNLAVDGRWRITALVRRGSVTVSVPLEVEAVGPPQFVSVLRSPGRPPAYTVDLSPRGAIRLSPSPERAGRSRLTITVYDVILNERAIERLVVTAGGKDASTKRLPVRRLSPSRFSADAVLVEGSNRIAVVAVAPDGARMRALFDLDLPAADE
jgi:copper transport protein